jgi:F-type H+-transporting ATPase subunit gamma
MASAELRIINRRIKSVKSTKKITRAMELIASSRIVKSQQRLTTSNNYTNLLSQIVEELTSSGEMPSSPVVEGTKKITLVVITSDRGLAGAYNTNILKLAEQRKVEYENLNNEVEIVTVGKKANGYFKYRNIEPKQNYEGITDEPNFENALEIMTPLVQEFYDGKTNQIEIVYTEYKSAMTQTALYKTVLPFEVEKIAKEIESTFEPSASQVLSNIIPKYTNATIFSALLNASTSEHAARMRAMKAATENAEELIKILSRKSNQARQAEITTEISEIVGGAEALAG